MNNQEIKNWLVQKIAEESDIQPETIKTDMPIESFNLDSLSMITLSYDLENALGKEIDPTVFWQHNTIDKLAEAIETLP
ncbi:acyl carrier protein [Lacibacter luteus]|uniref:Acyl carrier protein n=1 Tax=Lacibacter luteus TaxID=2508719 RepID=A0A4V1M7P9_9BACT|nr:acyl carrier protein [Lacibacter luteus]RXK60835.1 acyl carrier protein [Lacibacter luteus]